MTKQAWCENARHEIVFEIAAGVAAGAIGRSRPEQAIARDALRGVDEAVIRQAAQLIDEFLTPEQRELAIKRLGVRS